MNNVVPQPIIPALKPSFIESDFNIMRVASGEEEVDLINKWSKEKWTNEQHNPIPIGIPQSVSVKPSISPEANNKYISMEYNWYLELNGVNVLTRKNCLMLEIDPIMNSDSQYHFKLEPMTKYDYVITHTELGREKSEIKGTFTTGTKKWLIDHRFVE